MEGDDDERRIAHGFTAGIGLEFSLFGKNCNNDVTPTFLGYDAVDAVLRRVPSIVQGWGYDSVRTIGGTAAYHF